MFLYKTLDIENYFIYLLANDDGKARREYTHEPFPHREKN